MRHYSKALGWLDPACPDYHRTALHYIQCLLDTGKKEDAVRAKLEVFAFQTDPSTPFGVDQRLLQIKMHMALHEWKEA